MKMAPSKVVKRVKTGCATCRVRRIKCDEAKPGCKNCVSTGRKCDGYSSIPFSRRDLLAANQASGRTSLASAAFCIDTGPLPVLVTDPAFSDILEKRYFQFFRQRTVASTNSLIDCRFWDRLVLQICHSEPAVKHAVLALSSLHQLSDIGSDSETASQHRLYADRQYLRALKQAQALVESAAPRDIQRVLVACIVFICYENVRGNYKASTVHMNSGRAILAQSRLRLRRAAHRSDSREIEQLFGRLDLSALAFSDSRAPYEHKLSDFYSTDPELVPDLFRDVDEARAPLLDHIRWLLNLGSQIADEGAVGNFPELARLAAEKKKCALQLDQWHKCFEDAVGRAGPSSTLLVTTLRLWHAAAQLILRIEFSGPETEFDDQLPQFEVVLSYAKDLVESLLKTENARSFSFDLGYTIPLFMVATRCRHPVQRRRAIDLLWACPRQEGMWESHAAAAISKRFMEVEEEGLTRVETAADVPETNRVHSTAVVLDVDRTAASISLVMYPQGPESGWTIREERVFYGKRPEKVRTQPRPRITSSRYTFAQIDAR